MSNLPGFTAEASLGGKTGHYRTVYAGTANDYSRLILPQSAIGDFIDGILKAIGDTIVNIIDYGNNIDGCDINTALCYLGQPGACMFSEVFCD